MAIRGGLSEFSVPELLQLLALQQKTGVLTISHKQGHTHVLFFQRGRILGAADRRQSGRHAFLSHLYQNQHLTKDQVESVEDICRSTGQDLFTVLLTRGVMGRDRIAEEMQRYTQRVVDELVHWPDGTYEFSSGDEKSLPTQGLRLTLNPEELVLESMRRNDELATIKESMLAPELILARVEEAPSQPLPRECTVVLKLIDGEQTIQQICRLSPLGEYLTYDSISELLGRQQIMIVDPNDASRLASRKRRRARISWPAVAAMVSLIVGSALLGSGLRPLLGSSRNTEGWLDADAAHRCLEIRRKVLHDARDLEKTIRP